MRKKRKRPASRRATSAIERSCDRLTFALINRGAFLLEEGVALRPGDIDIVYVYGYGFPPHHGGPMWYADEVGVKHVYDRVVEGSVLGSRTAAREDR